MEKKIGEIFEHNGDWYQCLKSPDGSCKYCDMNFEKCPIPIKECTESGRSDKSYVIFKKLEKVGEPYMLEDKKFQKYKVFKTPYIYHKIDYSWQSFSDPYYISLEIKEDMEEKKDNYDGNMDKECIQICDALNSISDVHTTESCCGHCKDRFMVFFTCDNPHSLAIIARVFDRRYIGTSQPWYIELQTKDSGAYYYFIHSETKYDSEEVMMKDINQIIENIKYWCDDKFACYFKGSDDTKHSNSESIGKNLKPFNLEAAKAGKPVCTRDGRKARIICFDAKGNYPIIALIDNTTTETDIHYTLSGRAHVYTEADYDLMMLPEKKEGWLLVNKDESLFKSREEAERICTKEYVPVRVEFEI